MDDINRLIDNKFEIIGLEKFAVIIGLNPSKTARSPILWNACYQEYGINCRMYPLDVNKNNLKELPCYLFLFKKVEKYINDCKCLSKILSIKSNKLIFKSTSLFHFFSKIFSKSNIYFSKYFDLP